MFTLHPTLDADTTDIGDLAICKVLLNNKFSQYPWIILVPKRTGCKEITDVPPADYLPMMDEIRIVHDVMKAEFMPDKMNIGALGNMVPQLHIHIISRFKTDEAWPGPVWGKGAPIPYPDKGTAMATRLKKALGL